VLRICDWSNGLGRRQISTVNASIATSIRASQLTVEQIGADLPDGRVSTVGKWRLRQRAKLVRGLLTGGPITYPALIEIGTSGSGRTCPV
jgi:hypothetical protein